MSTDLKTLYADRAHIAFLIEHGTVAERVNHLPFWATIQHQAVTQGRAYAEAYQVIAQQRQEEPGP